MVERQDLPSSCICQRVSSDLSPTPGPGAGEAVLTRAHYRWSVATDYWTKTDGRSWTGDGPCRFGAFEIRALELRRGAEGPEGGGGDDEPRRK